MSVKHEKATTALPTTTATNKYKENKVEQTSMGFRPMYDNMFGLLLLDYRLRNN